MIFYATFLYNNFYEFILLKYCLYDVCLCGALCSILYTLQKSVMMKCVIILLWFYYGNWKVCTHHHRANAAIQRQNVMIILHSHHSIKHKTRIICRFLYNEVISLWCVMCVCLLFFFGCKQKLLHACLTHYVNDKWYWRQFTTNIISQNNFPFVPKFAEARIPKPLLEEAQCTELGHLGCGDGTCLPNEYFCDGSVDCPDGSDEGWCDVDNDPNAAEPCDLSVCKLPECFCSKDGTHIPGRLEPNQVPQMIMLTFDDAINFENWELYRNKILAPNRKNPNGCSLKGTFYVSHQYTNYQQVQKIWNDGHEIGVHSITWVLRVF